MQTPVVTDDPADLARPGTYEAGYPYALWARLRREAPVCRITSDGFEPFWAITKHADVAAIGKDAGRFRSSGRYILMPTAVDLDGSQSGTPPLRMLVNMDPPDHRHYRQAAAGWFIPRNLAKIEDRVRRRTRDLLAGLRRQGSEATCDVVDDLAAWLPLRVIMELLGAPDEDEALILRLTNENFGSADPEFQRPPAERDSFLRELGGYLLHLGRERRKHPRSDLAGTIATAIVDGKPLPDLELMSYLYLIATAGHETTRNAISGGVLALAENPDQFERLRADPGLIPTAVDEILRWTTPIVHFVRTATEDVEVRGCHIRAGDPVALFYPSANRDEEVFEAPDEFRVDRDPNPHLAFGLGPHYCLGAGLARLELRVLLEELLSACERFEVAGPVRRLRSNFVGGVKELPVRFTFTG